MAYAKTIVLTSGTSTTLPTDFNPGNNLVGCLAGGATGGSTNGGDGGAWAANLNVPLLPDYSYGYKVGAIGADSYFFGTSPSLITTAATNAGVTVLTFAGGVPSTIMPGMTVYDATTPGAIISGQQVGLVGTTTVTLTANVDAKVNSGDTIYFNAGQLIVAKGGASGGLAASSIGQIVFSGGVGAPSLGGGAAGPNGAGQGINADGGTVLGPTSSAGGNSGTEFGSGYGCGTGGYGFGGGSYGGGGGSRVGGGSSGAQGLIVIQYNPYQAQAGMLLGL
jgi:hypothetical protein